MTPQNPFEDDPLNVSSLSGKKEDEQDLDQVNDRQSPSRSQANPSTKRFDEAAFLDRPDFQRAPSETVERPPETDVLPRKRPLPGVVDVLLYPFGRAGVVTLAIMFGIPVVLIGFALACLWLCQAAPLLLLVAVPIAMAGGIVTVGMVLYFGWYLCECIRDSAAGGIRAPDTMGMTPGILEMFVQDFQLLVCVGVCLGLYSSVVNHLPLGKGLSWILMGSIVFLFPMTLLRVIMSESLQGLLPLMTLRFIGRALGRYCVLLLTLCVLPGLGYILLRTTEGWPLVALASSIGLYVGLVSAHLLGRFAWHCQDRLQWD